MAGRPFFHPLEGIVLTNSYDVEVELLLAMATSSKSGAVIASAGLAPAAVPAVVPPHGLARFRVFSPDAVHLAEEWSKYPEAPLPWVMDPAVVPTPGVEGGFWAQAAPYRGYVKPLSPGRANPHLHPIAAVEKVASDLAWKINLPVPPVTLWERAGAPAGQPRYHAVSAPPFDQILTWGTITADAGLYAVIAPLAAPIMSAMVAFDTWVHCHDHAGNHYGNLLVTTVAGPPVAAHFAFIDYSYAMTHTWRAMGHLAGWTAPMYDPTLVIDLAVLREAIAEIENVSDVFIQETVGRIPDPFLAAADRVSIIDGLIYRRNGLRKFLSVPYPGV